MKTIYLVLILFLVLGAGCERLGSSGFSAWRKWKEARQTSFNKKLATPTITSHIYFKAPGESYWVDGSKPYPRFSVNQCASCLWKLVLKGDKQLIVEKDSKSSVYEVETEIQLSDQLYLTSVYYADKKWLRVFVHDLGQKGLENKRERSFFDYDVKFIKEGLFSWLEKPQQVVIQRSDGSQETMYKMAKITTKIAGSDPELSVYGDTNKKQNLIESSSMLLFRDLTNGKTTYGAGRFLTVDFGKPIHQLVDGHKVTLDFNYSFSPPCAVSSGFHCPLPQDLVQTEISAGEKYQNIK